MNENCELLNSREAAYRLGLKTNTLEGWRLKGFGPKFIKVGRNVRYRISDLDEWLESRERNSTSEDSTPKKRRVSA